MLYSSNGYFFLMVECIILALVNDGLAPELVPGENYGYYWFILIRKRLRIFFGFSVFRECFVYIY